MYDVTVQRSLSEHVPPLQGLVSCAPLGNRQLVLLYNFKHTHSAQVQAERPAHFSLAKKRQGYMDFKISAKLQWDPVFSPNVQVTCWHVSWRHC